MITVEPDEVEVCLGCTTKDRVARVRPDKFVAITIGHDDSFQNRIRLCKTCLLELFMKIAHVDEYRA